jgi:hypothetical protein
MVGIVISANQDFPFAFSPSNSSLISRACSSVSPTASLVGPLPTLPALEHVCPKPSSRWILSSQDSASAQSFSLFQPRAHGNIVAAELNIEASEVFREGACIMESRPSDGAPFPQAGNW